MNQLNQPQSYIFDIPGITALRSPVIQEISHHVSLHEIMSNMLFIEFFSGEDRDVLRDEYKSSLYRRFNVYNVGHYELVDYAHYLKSLNIALHFNEQIYFKHPNSSWNRHAQTFLATHRNRFMNKFNSICIALSDVYDGLCDAYSKSPYHMGMLSNIKSRYQGFIPRVNPVDGKSFMITFIDLGLH